MHLAWVKELHLISFHSKISTTNQLTGVSLLFFIAFLSDTNEIEHQHTSLFYLEKDYTIDLLICQALFQELALLADAAVDAATIQHMHMV